jgi:hypothetical protein
MLTIANTAIVLTIEIPSDTFNIIVVFVGGHFNEITSFQRVFVNVVYRRVMTENA